MKYKVVVNDRSYEVEIEDLNTRPIIAHVEGQRFEIRPGTEEQPSAKNEADSRSAFTSPRMDSSSSLVNINEINSPLPGTVVEVFVKPGDEIESGQVVLVIEAMKMKNSIRSIRGGRIGEILVNTGQSVSHKQTLIKFAVPTEAAWI